MVQQQGHSDCSRASRSAGAVSAGKEPLTLAMTLSGGANPALLPPAEGASSWNEVPAGPALRYDGLVVSDASGRLLHSWLEFRRQSAAGARRCARRALSAGVDPILAPAGHKARRQRRGRRRGDRVERRAVLRWQHHADRRPANSSKGAVWCSRSGSTWTQQGKPLTGSRRERRRWNSAGAWRCPRTVTPRCIGGPRDNSRNGAAWAFTRSGSELEPAGRRAHRCAKRLAKASSAQASRCPPTATPGLSAASLITPARAPAYPRSSETWTQQGTKLTGTSAVGKPSFGSSVALSSEGNTALHRRAQRQLRQRRRVGRLRARWKPGTSQSRLTARRDRRSRIRQRPSRFPPTRNPAPDHRRPGEQQ